MIRYVVCTLVLAAFIYGLNRALAWLSDNLDVWIFLAICRIWCAIILILAFAYDRYERRSQQ